MKFSCFSIWVMTYRGLFILILLLATASAPAQLCQGSLGDPIVNINFGSGSNPGPAVAAVQNLQYQASDCPSDGYYTVRNNSASCFGRTWHAVSDHTSPGSGYFMLINGSYQPSVFYLETVSNLCSGTTYEFAAWLMNVQVPTACNGNIILPNVTFSIERTDGTIIQSYSTGNIAATTSPTWRQYGFFFTTPSSISSVVLRITNNAPGGCGNDIGLDDITFRPCGPQVQAGIVGITADSTEVCAGTSRNFQLAATISGGGTTTAYQWQKQESGGTWTDVAGATASTYTASINNATIAGTYAYRLAAADAANIGSPNCRVYSKPLTILVKPTPVATITTNGPACTGKSYLLKASGGGTYNWSGPNSFTSTDSSVLLSNIQPAQNGLYTITVTNRAGCTAGASFSLTALPSVQVSTSFSDTNVCQHTAIRLQASGGTTYQWTPPTNLSDATVANPIAVASDTIRYQVVAANTFGCTDTTYIHIHSVPLASANAGPDKTLIKGTNDVLEGSIRNRYAQFYWQPAAGLSSATTLQPQVIAAGNALYWLTAVSLNGCGTSTDTVRVRVYSDIYIPTAFTPNGDGKNDYWSIPALQAFSQYQLLVYNRFGQLVFQNKNHYLLWDGKANGSPLPTGTYVYYLTIADLKKSWRGTLLLVR